ncbi:hypothetical protein [Microbispora sp. H10670]|uniref:hypothetical protein n=1 Tax=Microbispora sp. H10670 TaxID=2729108 RepID=UPI0015FF6D9B|nr:hypothetical protein [Microbispora sp. H10670]
MISVIADSYLDGSIPSGCTQITDLYRAGVLVATTNMRQCRSGINDGVDHGSWGNENVKYYSTTCVYLNGIRRGCASSPVQVA